jgi:hypothetical protein
MHDWAPKMLKRLTVAVIAFTVIVIGIAMLVLPVRP